MNRRPSPVTDNKEALRTLAKCPLCHGWEYNPTEHGYGWCVDKIEQVSQPHATGDGELDALIGALEQAAINVWISGQSKDALMQREHARESLKAHFAQVGTQ